MERYSRDHHDQLLDTQKNKMMCNRLRKNATEELSKQLEDLVETIKSNQELRQISKPDPQTETEHDPRLQAVIGRYEASIDPTKPITGFQCRINTYEDKFVQCKPYVQPKYMNEQVDEIIKELEELDIIEESTSASTSPIVCMPKKNGKIRMCVDFTQANKITPKDHFLFPNIDHLI